jgi:hypothetical protein
MSQKSGKHAKRKPNEPESTKFQRSTKETLDFWDSEMMRTAKPLSLDVDHPEESNNAGNEST